MVLEKFISLFVVILGFEGSLFLSIGVLNLTPDIMAKQVGTYFDFNPYQVDNIASQKADFQVGIWLLLGAFIVQILNLVLDYDNSTIFVNYKDGVMWGCVFGGSIFLISMGARNVLKTFWKNKVVFALCQKYFLKCIEKGKIDWNYYKKLELDAKNFCLMQKEESETRKDFFIRYAKKLKVSIPENFNFKDIEEER